MVSLLIDADAGDTGAYNTLTDFVTTEGYRAAFNPAGGFEVLEWTTDNGAGGRIPEPATLALFSLGLVGLGYARLKKV